MISPTEERVAAFLAGLTRLTQETGVVIGGCGCCDSPGLAFQEDVLLAGSCYIASDSAGDVEWTTAAERAERNARKTAYQASIWYAKSETIRAAKEEVEVHHEVSEEEVQAMSALLGGDSK